MGYATWNAGTSVLGNNTHSSCHRLKAFKEAKVLVQFNKTEPRKSIKAWGNANTLDDLINNYDLDKNDLMPIESK